MVTPMQVQTGGREGGGEEVHIKNCQGPGWPQVNLLAKSWIHPGLQWPICNLNLRPTSQSLGKKLETGNKTSLYLNPLVRVVFLSTFTKNINPYTPHEC